MVGIQESVIHSLQKSGLARSVFPVHVPCIVVWPPVTDSNPLSTLHADLLASIRRRATYRHLVIIAQFVGLGIAWIGVTRPDGRTLTLIGVAITVVGAILAFVEKDRLANIDSRIEQLLNEYQASAIEWLRIWLEIGPYAYVNTNAAGVTKLEVLRERRNLLTSRAVDALSDWLGSLSEDENPREQRWSRLCDHLSELQRIDGVGRRRVQQSWLAFDVVRIGLLVLVFAVAIAIPTLDIPDVALATVATLMALSTRSANDVVLTIFSRPGDSLAFLSTISHPTLFGRMAGTPIRDLDETALENLAKMAAVIPRSLSKRRTARLVSSTKTP